MANDDQEKLSFVNVYGTGRFFLLDRVAIIGMAKPGRPNSNQHTLSIADNGFLLGGA